MKGKSANFWVYFKRIHAEKAGIWLLLVLLLCSNAIIIFKKENESAKIAYIDLPKVYSQFKMREELVQDLAKVERQREQILFSMETSLKSGSTTAGQKITQEDIDDKIQAFKEDNNRMLTAYDKQIWTQLNQYIKDYSRDNRFDILLGADGTGSVMAADEALNATQEMIAYVNNRYAGSKAK